MSIVTRVLRIFKADLHGILDAVEEPEAILRQALREMEEEIANTEAQLKRLERQEERLEKKYRPIDPQLEHRGFFAPVDAVVGKIMLAGQPIDRAPGLESTRGANDASLLDATRCRQTLGQRL